MFLSEDLGCVLKFYDAYLSSSFPLVLTLDIFLVLLFLQILS